MTEEEDLSAQRWRLDMDGYQVASVMAALEQFHQDHKDDPEYGLTGTLLSEIKPVRVK